MKKRLLILPLISLIALVGCKNDNSGNKKGDVVSPAVLKANTKPVKKSIFSDFELESILSVPSGNITFNNGFVIYETDDKISFYSQILKEKVLELPVDSYYVVYPSDVAGGFIYYITDGGTNVIDGLGNRLIENSNRTYSSLGITSGLNSKDIYYADVKFDDTSLYFHYDEKGKATLHSTNMGDDYGSGSTIQGLNYVLLDEYGHPGYQMIKNSSRYIVFDKKGYEISSFTDPNADASFFVGDYLIYQNSVKLDENNNNYDYISASGERYSLETYRINYLNAKKETITVPYLLETGADDIHSFKNAKGIITYAYANLKTISEKKILSSTKETYIIDASGNLHDNVTGINLGAFQRLGNNYYNTDSKTIYDGNLNEISILTNMNPIKVDNAEMMVCVVEGKYGAINQKGKVVLPFEYDYIYTDYISGNKAIVIDDGRYKIVTFDASKASYEDTLTFGSSTPIEYFGCGIYSTSEGYISLADIEITNYKHNVNSEVGVSWILANAINKASVVTTEILNNQETIYVGSINITR